MSKPSNTVPPAAALHSSTAVASPAWIGVEALRFPYLAMLRKLPCDVVRQFWSQHPLPLENGDFANGSELFSALWRANHLVPIEYQLDVLNHLERLLVDSGIDPYEFVSTSVCEVHGGTILPPRKILLWGSHLVADFVKSRDPHRTLASSICFFTRKFSRGLCQTAVDTDETMVPGRVRFVISRCSGDAAGEYRYAGPLGKYNADLWAALYIQMVPSALGLSTFASRRMIADPRPVSEAIPGVVHHSDGRLTLDGAPIGSIGSFYSVLQREGIRLEGHGVPDGPVVILEPELCNRLSLPSGSWAGCCYGAPLHLFELTYEPAEGAPKGLLSRIVDEAMGSQHGEWNKIRKAHQQVLDCGHPPTEIVYDSREDKLVCGTRLVCRSTPARILTKMLRDYLAEGTTEFSHQGILLERGLVAEIGAPNVHIRMKRLSEACRLHCPCIRIRLGSRGSVRLVVKSPVVLREL